jgi:hypothetical protein
MKTERPWCECFARGAHARSLIDALGRIVRRAARASEYDDPVGRAMFLVSGGKRCSSGLRADERGQIGAHPFRHAFRRERREMP